MSQLFDNRDKSEKRPLWTMEDLARYLSVSKRTVEDWVYRRKIPFRKINGCVRFAQDEIERWTLQQSKE